jgi:hypothetical protein
LKVWVFWITPGHADRTLPDRRNSPRSVVRLQTLHALKHRIVRYQASRLRVHIVIVDVTAVQSGRFNQANTGSVSSTLARIGFNLIDEDTCV